MQVSSIFDKTDKYLESFIKANKIDKGYMKYDPKLKKLANKIDKCEC